MELIETLWGHGEHLNMVQMSVRALVMFFITLALIRLAGMRTFGTKTAVDNIVTITLGAILARGVVGASPFFSTVAAGLVITVVHRVLAILGTKSDAISHAVKNTEVKLIDHGSILKEGLETCDISEGDLMEGLRENGNVNKVEEVQEAYMERTGKISVIKKKE